MAVYSLQQYDLIEPGRFHTWKDPEASQLPDTVTGFLAALSGPAHIHVSGEDSTRCRFATTLLHGNEPSGLLAVFALLKKRVRPAVDIHFLIPGIDAARQPPGFRCRMLPQHKDLNRCFGPAGGDSEQELLAREILQRLESFRPESVIDIHNTSGSNPPFGVCIFRDQRHDALVSLFTHRIIVSDLKLGALMEISNARMPVVTIECGGSQDEESHRLAIAGLERYITTPDVLSPGQTGLSLEYFRHPIRLELKPGCDIAYGDHSLLPAGITLLPDIEDYNFGYVDGSNQLGFVSGDIDSILSIRSPLGNQPASALFEQHQGAIFPSRRLKLFMITTNPEIARKDCLFYLVRADQEA